MKKLKLDKLSFNPPEMLSRVQLRNVMGGFGSGSGSGGGSGTGGSSDCTNPCSGYTGMVTTTHACDPCGMDKTKTEHDLANQCCL